MIRYTMYRFLTAMGYKTTPERIIEIGNVAWELNQKEGHPWGYKTQLPDLKTWIIDLDW